MKYHPPPMRWGDWGGLLRVPWGWCGCSRGLRGRRGSGNGAGEDRGKGDLVARHGGWGGRPRMPGGPDWGRGTQCQAPVACDPEFKPPAGRQALLWLGGDEAQAWAKFSS